MANPDQQFEGHIKHGKYTEWGYGIMIFVVFVLPIIFMVLVWVFHWDIGGSQNSNGNQTSCRYVGDEYVCDED